MNIDTRESEPGKISQKEIENLLESMKVEFLDPQAQRAQPNNFDGIPLATPFLLMVAGMLLVEGLMVRKE